MTMINHSFLDQLKLATPFSTIETEFGRFLCRLSRMPAKADNDVPDAGGPSAPEAAVDYAAGSATDTDTDALWQFLAHLLLRYVRDGHSCVDVEHWRQALLAQLQNEDEKAALTGEARVNFCAELSALSASAVHDAIRALAKANPLIIGSKADEGTPLVFQGDRLYLNKYRQYELDIAAWVHRAMAVPGDAPVPLAEIRRCTEDFRSSKEDPDFQQLAVQQALSRRFAIITGGPGTGKTTVLSAILALICREHPQWRIALAAPTGKAKVRMQEAITAGVEKLSADVVADEVKEKLLSLPASTVHTLIGLRPDMAKPIYHAGKRLPYDLVVVDEASMVSLPNMAQLIRALRPDARLLLLGDKDQLSSVETGSVLADLCQCQTLKGAIAVLHKNYRAKGNCVLTECAKRVVETKDPAAIAQLAEDFYTTHADPSQPGAEFNAIDLPGEKKLTAALRAQLKQWDLFAWKDAQAVAACFKYVESFKILASNREGPFGVVNLNKIVPEILGIKPFANGTPLMILENDKLTGLNNGDIGVVWENQVHFPNPEWDGKDSKKQYRVFALGGLPSYELVYAMTIHKSQGSDYNKVLMVLPEKDNPVLTRELVYTGITRTKLKFRLWAPKEVLKTAFLRPTRRISGLVAALDNGEA